VNQAIKHPTYEALGSGGQTITIMPYHSAVVVTTSNRHTAVLFEHLLLISRQILPSISTEGERLHE
jgi:hypothetical protein